MERPIVFDMWCLCYLRAKPILLSLLAEEEGPDRAHERTFFLDRCHEKSEEWTDLSDG